MTGFIQLPPLGFRTALDSLRGPISGGYARVPTRSRVSPVVTNGAHAKSAFRHCSRTHVAFVLRYASMVSDLGRTCLLRMQCCRQGVDLAFEFGNAAIGLFLSLSRRRGCNTLDGQLAHAMVKTKVIRAMCVLPLRIACMTCRAALDRNGPVAACQLNCMNSASPTDVPSVRDTNHMLGDASYHLGIWQTPESHACCLRASAFRCGLHA
jgi:hypothetical protein